MPEDGECHEPVAPVINLGREERKGKRGEGCIAWVKGEAQSGATSRAVNHICTARSPHWHTATSTDMGLARHPDGSPHYTPLKANGHDKHWHNKQLVTAVGMDFTCRGPDWRWALASSQGHRGILGPWFYCDMKKLPTVVTATSHHSWSSQSIQLLNYTYFTLHIYIILYYSTFIILFVNNGQWSGPQGFLPNSDTFDQYLIEWFPVLWKDHWSTGSSNVPRSNTTIKALNKRNMRENKAGFFRKIWLFISFMR